MADHRPHDGSGLLASNAPTSRRDWVALAILFFVNLINYMDRVTIASVLDDVKLFYNLSDQQSGFLQTAFVISYMIFAPLFGYLGDRYSRKILMAAGVLFWSVTTLIGSWPPQHFGVFLFLRGLVGVGEASYSTIAPTIIGDLFPEGKRTLALGVFYYAIPIGSGLGYMLGSNVASALGAWYWALRITPVLGVVATLLILFVLREPPRGEADGGVHIASTSMWQDCKDLVTNMSFVWSTLGFTAATFALGAMSWWAPVFVTRAQAVHDDNPNKDKINFIFGTITCIGGAFGITLAVWLSGTLRTRWNRADPAICGSGLILGAPLILCAVLLAASHQTLTWVLFFFGLTLLSLNWSVVPDMLLYTVLPNRRGTASAMQILVSHMLGDAASPYIVGVISDWQCNGCTDKKQLFESLRNAMLLPVGVLLVGGAVFMLNIFTVVRDRERCQMQMQDRATPNNKAGRVVWKSEDSNNNNNEEDYEDDDYAEDGLDGGRGKHSSRASIELSPSGETQTGGRWNKAYDDQDDRTSQQQQQRRRLSSGLITTAKL